MLSAFTQLKGIEKRVQKIVGPPWKEGESRLEVYKILCIMGLKEEIPFIKNFGLTLIIGKNGL